MSDNSKKEQKSMEEIMQGLVFYDEDKGLFHFNYNEIHAILKEMIEVKEDTIVHTLGELYEDGKETYLGMLLNASYKFDNYLEFTDLEEKLRKEIGFLGRMFIRDLYETANDLNQMDDVPFPYLSNVTEETLITALNSCVGNVLEESKEKSEIEQMNEVSKDLLLYDEPEDSVIISYKETYDFLERLMTLEKGRQYKEGTLFKCFVDVLDDGEEVVVNSLLNAKYKHDNNIEYTDVEETLMEEIGNHGRTFIKCFYETINDNYKKIDKMPVPNISTLTIDKFNESLDKYSKDAKCLKKTKQP